MKLLKIFFLLLCAASIGFTVSCTQDLDSATDDVLVTGKYTAKDGYVFQICGSNNDGCNECHTSDVIHVSDTGHSTYVTMHIIEGPIMRHVIIENPCIYRQVRPRPISSHAEIIL
jgi:hypothetical protein